MTKKFKHGTLSTIAFIDTRIIIAKNMGVVEKAQKLCQGGFLRITSHANIRMHERRILHFELLQALATAKHEPRKDRYSVQHGSWQYSLVGKTIDERILRLGVAFEKIENSNEMLLIITVIDLSPENKKNET